jgi:hypothetical protein
MSEYSKLLDGGEVPPSYWRKFDKRMQRAQRVNTLCKKAPLPLAFFLRRLAVALAPDRPRRVWHVAFTRAQLSREDEDAVFEYFERSPGPDHEPGACGSPSCATYLVVVQRSAPDTRCLEDLRSLLSDPGLVRDIGSFVVYWPCSLQEIAEVKR